MALNETPDLVLYTSGPRGSVIGSGSKTTRSIARSWMVSGDSSCRKVSSRPEIPVRICLDTGRVG